MIDTKYVKRASGPKQRRHYGRSDYFVDQA